MPLAGGSVSKPRRIACNYLHVDDKKLINHVVEICNDEVIDYYPLLEEQPSTEWIGEKIEITNGKAYRIL